MQVHGVPHFWPRPPTQGEKGLARETKFNHGGDHSKDSNGATIHSQPLQQEPVGDEGTL